MPFCSKCRGFGHKLFECNEAKKYTTPWEDHISRKIRVKEGSSEVGSERGNMDTKNSNSQNPRRGTSRAGHGMIQTRKKQVYRPTGRRLEPIKINQFGDKALAKQYEMLAEKGMTEAENQAVHPAEGLAQKVMDIDTGIGDTGLGQNENNIVNGLTENSANKGQRNMNLGQTTEVTNLVNNPIVEDVNSPINEIASQAEIPDGINNQIEHSYQEDNMAVQELNSRQGLDRY